MLPTTLVLWIKKVQQSMIMKKNSSGNVVTKIQYFKSSKCWVSKPVRKKKQKEYWQEIMEKVAEINARDVIMTPPISQNLQQILRWLLVQKTWALVKL